jgi:hypothetical protein
VVDLQVLEMSPLMVEMDQMVLQERHPVQVADPQAHLEMEEMLLVQLEDRQVLEEELSVPQEGILRELELLEILQVQEEGVLMEEYLEALDMVCQMVVMVK